MSQGFSPGILLHSRPGNAFSRQNLSRVADHCRRSRRNRRIDVAIAIGRFATEGYEQIARTNTPRIIFDAVDLRIAVSESLKDSRMVGDELEEDHVFLAELTRLDRSRVNHADQSSGGAQRRTDE